MAAVLKEHGSNIFLPLELPTEKSERETGEEGRARHRAQGERLGASVYLGKRKVAVCVGLAEWPYEFKGTVTDGAIAKSAKLIFPKGTLYCDLELTDHGRSLQKQGKLNISECTFRPVAKPVRKYSVNGPADTGPSGVPGVDSSPPAQQAAAVERLISTHGPKRAHHILRQLPVHRLHQMAALPGLSPRAKGHILAAVATHPSDPTTPPTVADAHEMSEAIDVPALAMPPGQQRYGVARKGWY